MSLNWINTNEFSFNSFLLMERFQIRYICNNCCNGEELKTNLGIALYYNPVVKWYFVHKCPECKPVVDEITASIPSALNESDVRKSEVYVMQAVEDFIVYCYPEIMEKSCNFIYAWNKERLFELVDFSDKVVLDVGSGSGRLAFAAAEKARHVYASEPVDTLREYLRDMIVRNKIENITVVDGKADAIPYPNSTFDIVMSGHVVGDDYDGELAELTRVVKNCGYILDCPGEDDRKNVSDKELIKRGFNEYYYVSNLGGDVYRYSKQIFK
jgi:ubiquinone/menaquinone biosynthesis C-methylase UbiE